jgi:hypothetical protein
MEGETRKRLLEERERGRLRQELRHDSEREQQEDRLRELQAQRERLRGAREATHERDSEREQEEDRLRELQAQRERLRGEREGTQEQARRVQQSREEARARTVSDRAAGRALAKDRRSAREDELRRAQLDRETRRRPAGGDRPQIDETYKSALEYDIYVRNNFGTRESFMQQASRAQRHEAEHVFRAIDAAAANGGEVSDPELLRYRVAQVRASVERASAWPKRRAWLMAVALCIAVLALMYFVL